MEQFSEEQVCKSPGRSLYDVKVTVANRTIAMGRILGDGLYYLIVDIVVQPEFQGNGIENKIIDILLQYVDDNTPSAEGVKCAIDCRTGKGSILYEKGITPHIKSRKVRCLCGFPALCLLFELDFP